MINEISNMSKPQVITPPNNTLLDKYTTNEKSLKSDKKIEETTAKIVLENGKLIVERYDKNGKLIRKTPPGYRTLGESV